MEPIAADEMVIDQRIGQMIRPVVVAIGIGSFIDHSCNVGIRGSNSNCFTNVFFF